MACEINNFSHSAYYNWLKKPKVTRQQFDSKTRSALLEAFYKSKRNYGRKRLKIVLEAQNIQISEYKIAKFMKLHKLQASKKGRNKWTRKLTKQQLSGRFPNLLRDFVVTKPWQVLVTDITELPYFQNRRKAYLCTFRDPFHGQIVGYAIDKNQNAALVTSAFNSIKNKFPYQCLTGLIIHSDNGSQFLAKDFQEKMVALKIQWSNSRTYCSTDNAFAETWFASMKTELLKQNNFETLLDLYEGIKGYISWYNEKRIFTRLKMAPQEFIQNFFNNSKVSDL